MEIHDRLKQARIDAGYASAAEAARAMGAKVPTYSGHENGTTPPPRQTLLRYAQFYKKSVDYLLTGRGKTKPRAVKLVGYVGAGAAMNLYRDGQDLDEWVEAPDGSTADTVAVEIKGESLGPLFDRWLVFYDDRRDPVTRDMVGKLCILGLADGRVLIKKLTKGGIAGYWTLLSNFEPPIYDVAVEWGAVVKSMVPR